MALFKHCIQDMIAKRMSSQLCNIEHCAGAKVSLKRNQKIIFIKSYFLQEHVYHFRAQSFFSDCAFDDSGGRWLFLICSCPLFRSYRVHLHRQHHSVMRSVAKPVGCAQSYEFKLVYSYNDLPIFSYCTMRVCSQILCVSGLKRSS